MHAWESECYEAGCMLERDFFCLSHVVRVCGGVYSISSQTGKNSASPSYIPAPYFLPLLARVLARSRTVGRPPIMDPRAPTTAAAAELTKERH